MREVVAADRLGAKAERGGDAGRVHDAAPAGWHSVGMGDSSGPEIDARYRPAPGLLPAPREARARGPAGSGLEAGCKKSGEPTPGGADSPRRREDGRGL